LALGFELKGWGLNLSSCVTNYVLL